MTTKRTAPAKKTYCVWADYVRRMYQHVEATGPQEAYQIAKDSGGWEFCDWHDNNSYRLSNEVQDLETEEFIAIDGNSHCKTCGSEVVETVNDSNFRDGECSGCEYQRYKTQPELLDLCNRALGFLRSWEKVQNITTPTEFRLSLESAITKANGHAA